MSARQPFVPSRPASRPSHLSPGPIHTPRPARPGTADPGDSSKSTTLTSHSVPAFNLSGFMKKARTNAGEKGASHISLGGPGSSKKRVDDTLVRPPTRLGNPQVSESSDPGFKTPPLPIRDAHISSPVLEDMKEAHTRKNKRSTGPRDIVGGGSGYQAKRFKSNDAAYEDNYQQGQDHGQNHGRDEYMRHPPQRRPTQHQPQHHQAAQPQPTFFNASAPVMSDNGQHQHPQHLDLGTLTVTGLEASPAEAAHLVAIHERGSARWADATLDEWREGAEELKKRWSELLSMAIDHIMDRTACYANLHARAADHQSQLMERSEQLQEAREEFARESGKVAGGIGPFGGGL
ncbi:hypothetical protein OF83DRAFT_458559 [Amylostereum chailletii]|nr:hypothetical protein OF83DRAFT_458559 [Amylostereum chailletii]